MTLNSPVVVIGHGRTPQGRKWGARIDAVPTVVRMWNWAWQDPIDYGIKYTQGFYEINTTEMARFHRHNVRTPKDHWVATMLSSNVGPKKYEGPLPSPTVLASSVGWEATGRLLGGGGEKGRLVLTRGVRAACWAIQQAPVMVILVGFDNVRCRTGLSIEHGFHPACVTHPSTFPFRDYVGGSPKYRNHDYSVEEDVLLMLAKKHDVVVHHAQDIW